MDKQIPATSQFHVPGWLFMRKWFAEMLPNAKVVINLAQEFKLGKLIQRKLCQLCSDNGRYVSLIDHLTKPT
jgi:hypothetical protein